MNKSQHYLKMTRQRILFYSLFLIPLFRGFFLIKFIMTPPALLKEADLESSTWAGTLSVLKVHASVPNSFTWNDNIATFRLALGKVEEDPEWVLAAIATSEFTIGTIWLPNYTTTTLPDGQELLRKLAQNGKAKEVMAIVNKMNIDGGLWAIIPLCEALIENGEVQWVWEKISWMDFEKEGRWFFGGRYSKLILIMQEKKYTNPDMVTALEKLGK